MNKKPFKLELKKNGGCEDCTKDCLSNSKCAIPNVADKSKGHKFPCNNSKDN